MSMSMTHSALSSHTSRLADYGRTGGVLMLLAACGSEPGAASADAEPVLAVVEDENPDPQIVEVSLEARAGLQEYTGASAAPVWTYNGTVPGPLIEASAGDELVVHFQNSLPEDTTIHWHGVRVPAAMDGTLAVQAPITPGSTFEYRFQLKDPGLFWFHPHIRSDVQVEKGLHGVIRVRGDRRPRSALASIRIGSSCWMTFECSPMARCPRIWTMNPRCWGDRATSSCSTGARFRRSAGRRGLWNAYAS
jgi:FtsP/CotA-like multicopper oxidase with cupredoxin domain